MDLELTDEQTWLRESLTTLLEREWPAAESAHEAGRDERARLWRALVEFGALNVDRGEGLGAVELCLVARALGMHLASAPFLGSAALRYAAEPLSGDLPEAFGDLADDRVSVALLEPGRGWSVDAASTAVGLTGLEGRKVAVEHADEVDRLAVVASAGTGPALALVAAGESGVRVEPQPSLDVTIPVHAITSPAPRPTASPTAT